MIDRRPLGSTVAALAMGVLVACSTPTPPAASNRSVEATPNPPPTGANAESPSTTPMPTASKFTLEYVITTGPTLGDGIQQYQSTLTIDGGTAVARLDSVRAGGDAEGVPIGRFEATMDPAELADLSRRAAAIKPLPPTQRGGPGTSTIVLRYRADAVQWEQALNSNDPAMLAGAESLLEPLNLMIGRLYATPAAALALDVLPGSGPSAPFVVRLRNIGRVELAVLDPTALRGPDHDAWAGIQVAPFPAEQPGVTSPPLVWERVELGGRAPAGPRTAVVLAPGAHLDWPTAPWSPKVPGRHLVQAIVADYAGPAVIDTRTRVRGALFSTGLEHTP